MPRVAAIPPCSEEERKILEQWASSRTQQARLVERARMVLGCLEGRPVQEVAERVGVRPNTVIAWRKRFAEQGHAGTVRSTPLRKAQTL